MLQYSVIIPAYNCEKTLAATVDSIHQSGLHDYELILIDDGSTDETPALCDQLCHTDPRIRCVHQKNAGVSAARNRGIDEARGDYIWFVDADDTISMDSMRFVAELVRKARADLIIFGLCFDYYYHDHYYHSEALIPPHEGWISPSELSKQFQTFYASNSLSSACTKLFRRDILDVSGLRFHEDMHLMEDFLFVLEFLSHCTNIFCFPTALYHYRQTEDERGAYRRLLQVSDLVNYMEPFRSALRSLSVPDSDRAIAAVYTMLLRQKLYYAPLRSIRAALAAHQNGPYASYMQASALGLYLKNRKGHLRHRLAILYKSTAQRLKFRTMRQNDRN